MPSVSERGPTRTAAADDRTRLVERLMEGFPLFRERLSSRRTCCAAVWRPTTPRTAKTNTGTRTVVPVRVSPASQCRVAAGTDGILGLYLDGARISDVGLPPMPDYYRHTLANGKSVMEVAPTIQCGYLIHLTVFRVRQYFGAGRNASTATSTTTGASTRRLDAPARA